MAPHHAVLDALQAFVEAAVDPGPLPRGRDPLRARLDVIQRAVELLRIRSGWETRRVRVRDLLNAGIGVQVRSPGGPSLCLGGADRGAMWNWPVRSERKEMELQAALLVYLLHYHRAGDRIGELIVEFANLIRDQLAPADAETTETGVTRIMTTIRSAARTLRIYGLLTHSQRVAHRTWELSVFGILVAVRLHERGQRLALPPRFPYPESPGPSGSRFILAPPVMEVVRELSHPTAAARLLRRVCRPNADVFDSFAPAMDAVRGFCRQLDHPAGAATPPLGVLRQQAEAMMRTLASVVPPAVLVEDLARHFALEELLGS